MVMVTSVTKGGTQKLPKTFTIVGTYWHDHSLESSRGAHLHLRLSEHTDITIHWKALEEHIQRLSEHTDMTIHWKALEEHIYI
jgi:hypothetical protein